MQLATLKNENLDILNDLGIKLQKQEYANALSELLVRVAATYINPLDYLEVLRERLTYFSNVVHDELKFERVFDYYAKKWQPKQIVAIANTGLPLGALAMYLGHSTRIIEAHTEFDRYRSDEQLHPAWKCPRNRTSGSSKPLKPTPPQ